MPGRDIIVVGASAGGVAALQQLARNLPPDLAAAVFVVLHFPSEASSFLAGILKRIGPLPASTAVNGEAIEHGRIYVALPDKHLLIKRGYVQVVHGPRENRHRPSVDVLFRTAARAYGPRVVGVVLSGALDDGTAGLLAIKERGGVALVQDPSEALIPGMPLSAMENVQVDHCLSASAMGPLLSRLVQEKVEEEEIAPASSELEKESKIAELDMATMENQEKPGTPSAFTCPECNGTLWELREGDLLRFRCRVGHAYSAESMVAGQGEASEVALWAALRALEERIALMRRLTNHARERNHHSVAERFAEQAQDTEQHAAVLREMLLKYASSV